MVVFFWKNESILWPRVICLKHVQIYSKLKENLHFHMTNKFLLTLLKRADSNINKTNKKLDLS